MIVVHPDVFAALESLLTKPYSKPLTAEAAALDREMRTPKPGDPRSEREVWWRWVRTRNKPSPYDDLHPSNLRIPSRALRMSQVAARGSFAGIARSVLEVQDGEVESTP